jgi:hypothetical protein
MRADQIGHGTGRSGGSVLASYGFISSQFIDLSVGLGLAITAVIRWKMGLRAERKYEMHMCAVLGTLMFLVSR